MRIVVENPRANGKRVKATAQHPKVLMKIYADRISRLDECRHLGNDKVDFYIKMRILVDLINPSNIIRFYRLANPATLQNNLN